MARRGRRGVFSRSQIDGWAFDAEVLALARGLGYSATEQGILWINGEQSRLSMARTIVPGHRATCCAPARPAQRPRREPAPAADVAPAPP